jgi:ribosomal protein S18 acetylase RimI-like enzyme
MSFKIRKGNLSDLESLKDMMLLALETDPDAFSVTLPEYKDNSMFWWESYLYPFLTEDQQTMYFGVDDGKIVSMGGVIYEEKEKKRHIASIVWVYTKPENRGHGYSKILMNEIFKAVKEQKHLRKISLMVASTQSSAVELYKSFGFDLNGVLKGELKSKDKYIDVYLMEKKINNLHSD